MENKKLALILFGLSYGVRDHWHKRRYFIDYKVSYPNYKKFIFEYFESLGYEIDVFFCTNNDIPEEEKNKLIDLYKPVDYCFSSGWKNDKIYNAVNCCMKSGKEYDHYLITRFDMEFKIPFNECNFDFNKFNMVSVLEKPEFLCDNFYFMNKELFPKFKQVLGNNLRGNHHKLGPQFEKVIGEINFVKNEKTRIPLLTFYKIVRRLAK